MSEGTRSRKILLVSLIALVLLFGIFASLKIDHDNRSRNFLNAVKDNPDAMEAFEKLRELTSQDSVVFSWWDYGRLIKEFGHREPVVALASREIIESIGESRNPIHAFEMQLFGQFESHEKIVDIATAFLASEEESLAIMKKYRADYVMVFCDKEGYGDFDDLYKLPWIARIAGENVSDYLIIEGVGTDREYILGPKAENATILRLAYDERFHPSNFNKIFENNLVKIYWID